MNKKAIKISLRGLAPKGYTSSLLQCPSIGLHPGAALKRHFRDRNTTELWPNDKRVNEEYIPCWQQQQLEGSLCCLNLSAQSVPRKMCAGMVLNVLLGAHGREKRALLISVMLTHGPSQAQVTELKCLWVGRSHCCYNQDWADQYRANTISCHFFQASLYSQMNTLDTLIKCEYANPLNECYLLCFVPFELL